MKLELSELRIGNTILINGKEITMTAKIFHAVIHDFDGYTPEPIPLTEERLLKFGFGKAVELIDNEVVLGFGLKINESTAIIFNDGDISLTDVDLETILIEIKYGYVHQLQNLYFALTGVELILKS